MDSHHCRDHPGHRLHSLHHHALCHTLHILLLQLSEVQSLESAQEPLDCSPPQPYAADRHLFAGPSQRLLQAHGEFFKRELSSNQDKL
ncbi:hypothetical protein AVEN_13739-1 [Araneus ventricosus]|uniref:Uncharacterized protein n=1 Tax=Araneus ventricosus TaxID=182803 RepID=A0A4Y2LLU3_ARAVE|nr:hypothetical protein AVEN_13739-1 [Araneus ventricosus]